MSSPAERRRQRFAPNVEAQRIGILTCACGKRAYVSRGDARSALRRLFPGRDGMRVYRCPRGEPFFHFGHPGPADR